LLKFSGLDFCGRRGTIKWYYPCGWNGPGKMSRHRSTLEAVFGKPTKSDIEWREIEALLKHLGADITNGAGSRVRIHLNGAKGVFQRPHQQKEAGKGTVESMRRFFENAGVTP